MPRGNPTPLAGPRSSGRRGSPTKHNTRCTSRPPTASPARLKGGKKKKKSQGAKLPHKFPRGWRSAEQGEQSLKGISSFLYKTFSLRKVPTAQQDHTAQKSQVKSLVQTLPLHLVQVGWGSRSKRAWKAPHFLAPTPGQTLNSFDIAK